MKTSELINLIPALRELAQAKIPALHAYRIGIVMPKVATLAEAYESQRNGLLMRLGTPIKDQPGAWELGENMKEFQCEIDSIHDEPADITLPKIPLAALEKADMTANDMAVLAEAGVVTE